MPYESTPADKRRALLLGIAYLFLAVFLGVMLFKIWPPVPWPDPNQDLEKGAINEAYRACGWGAPAWPTPTPAQPAAQSSQQNGTPAPATAPATAQQKLGPVPIPIQMAGKCINTTFDERLLLLVIIAGMLGAFVHAATSIADYVGNNRFSSRWTWFYVLRPAIGMGLALVFYFVVRGGFLTTNVGATDINPYGIAALAGLVGMFSKQATDKLSEVFSTLFRSGEGDAKRADPLHPTPGDSLKAAPPEVTAGGEAFELIVTGAGFVDGCLIQLGDVAQPTTFESATTLHAQVAKEIIATAQVLKLTVVRPDQTKYPEVEFKVVAPGGGVGAGGATGAAAGTETAGEDADAADVHDLDLKPDTPDEDLPITEGGVG